MIAIMDYGAGNLLSVEKALRHLGQETVITSDRDVILSAEGVILPGVGSFGSAMEEMRRSGMDKVAKEAAESGKPFLGICLGLQLLFEESDETPGEKGLGILKGKIVRIPEEEGLKIPQIGWNSLSIRSGSRLFAGIPDGSYVYFVHSYYLQAADKAEVAATVDYGTTLDVAVERGNLFATQFHPEKSGTVGLSILKNFAAICGGEG